MATKKKKVMPLKDWHTIHARLSNEDYELMQETAKTDKRSVTKLAELVLSNWINSIKKSY